MALLVLLNNFLHDFSAAGWLFGAVLLWSARREGSGDATGPEAVRRLVQRIRRLMVFCLGGIVFFGAVRALAYRQYEWSAAAGQAQVGLLIGKHALFFLVFFIGLREFILAGQRQGKRADEAA